VSYLLRYRARAAAALSHAEIQMPGAPTDITARRDGETLVVTAWQGGWPCPATEVTLHWPGGGQAQATTDLAGRATFTYPKLTRSGFIGVRARVVEGVQGEQEGKKYTEVHHWTTLSFPVSVPLSTSQTLRKALSDNHDVIGRAAFNTTLFSGTITRQQAELHLRQRALILSEVDRILRTAPTLSSVYGPAQKASLEYLRRDLSALGLGVLPADEAGEGVRELLEELRESEVRGPYFALGVWHVFYGGTVHGGRVIGERLERVLGVALTHYRKTDGYAEYIAAVDAIAVPDLGQELLLGGQTTYRRLLIAMNARVFQANLR
jgi:hypothetical protein